MDMKSTWAKDSSSGSQSLKSSAPSCSRNEYVVQWDTPLQSKLITKACNTIHTIHQYRCAAKHSQSRTLGPLVLPWPNDCWETSAQTWTSWWPLPESREIWSRTTLNDCKFLTNGGQIQIISLNFWFVWTFWNKYTWREGSRILRNYSCGLWRVCVPRIANVSGVASIMYHSKIHVMIWNATLI